MRADVLEREPAGEAELLEEGVLGLGRDAGGGGGVDQRERVGEDRGGGRRSGGRAAPGDLGERAARLGGARGGGGPEAVGVGIDPDDDLGLARLDGGREAGAEGLDRGTGATSGAPALPAPPWACRSDVYLTAFLRPEPAVKRGTLLAAIVIDSPVRGLRPSRAPRWATWNLPKPVNETSSPP